MESTKSTNNILILWLLAVAMAVIMLAALAMGHHSVAVPRVHTWQADSSWVKSWNF